VVSEEKHFGIFAQIVLIFRLHLYHSIMTWITEETISIHQMKLQNLHLSAEGYPIKWESCLKWIGEGELEDVSLNLMTVPSDKLVPLLMNSEDILKQIELQYFGSDTPTKYTSPTGLSFPNLDLQVSEPQPLSCSSRI